MARRRACQFFSVFILCWTSSLFQAFVKQLTINGRHALLMESSVECQDDELDVPSYLNWVTLVLFPAPLLGELFFSFRRKESVFQIFLIV